MLRHRAFCFVNLFSIVNSRRCLIGSYSVSPHITTLYQHQPVGAGRAPPAGLRNPQPCGLYLAFSVFRNPRTICIVGRGLDPSLLPYGNANLTGNPYGRGGACPAREFTAIATLRATRSYGFPLWGKLSPQVTDEGEPAGYLTLIRRAGAPPSPKRGRLSAYSSRNLPHKLCLSVNKTTIYTLPKNSARNLSKNSKNLLTKYDNLW